VGLDREGQEQGGHRGLDHHVGESERLDDRIDRGGVVRDVEVVRRDRAGDVADREQQNVGRGLTTIRQMIWWTRWRLVTTP
jgi:hypothetical protein